MDLTKYYAKPDKTIKEHNDDLLKALDVLWNLKYIKDTYLFDMVRTSCIYHDYGKVNAQFQIRVKSDKKKKFNENAEVAHNVLSLYFLPENEFENPDDYYRVGQAILNHHDYCDVLEVLQDEEKKDLISSLLNEFSDIQSITRKKINKIHKMIDDKDTILIKGFLHRCDYSASAGMEVEYPNDFLPQKLSELNYEWKELQQFCMKHTEKNIIAVAQTGMGKTEGGLLWIGKGKGFFILPIRTAINSIYDRVRKGILKGEKLEERVALLHSDALEYYQRNLAHDELDIVDYHERGKKLSMPLTICTMDQLFDFVFGYNGYEMKLTTLSYSKIVLDEIQMYSPDLLAYLICGIEKICKFGGKVGIVTATLPPFVREELKQAMGHEVVEGTFIDSVIRHNIKVLDDKINTEMICQKYLENMKSNKSNKILVVCNTIKKAQEVYFEIKNFVNEHDNDLMKTDSINLLHSRFIKEHRAKKEEVILEFGKTFKDKDKEILDNQSGIWIATSIVEASLDIDFDYLFTELSDLNGLFQRFGRCNRKGKKSTKEANCFVFTNVDLGKNIDREIFQLSKDAVSGIKGEIDEKQKLQLIEEYFSVEKIRKSEYFLEYKKIKEDIGLIASHEMERSKINMRNISSTHIIPSPVFKENEKELIRYKDLMEIDKEPFIKKQYYDFIRNLTISIPTYIMHKETTIILERVDMGKFDKMPVLECEYSYEIGFREIDYSNYKRESNLL